MYRSFFPQFSSIEQEAVSEEIEMMGDWAFAWGRESIVLVPQGDGTPIRMDGKGLSILKRQADGSWKCARAINNSQVLATP
jgi:ketosteroid isomerase-like protein